MPWFWVSYSVLDDTGGQRGTGSGEFELTSAPGSGLNVRKLADGITDEGRRRGLMSEGQFASVLSWSPMGDQPWT